MSKKGPSNSPMFMSYDQFRQQFGQLHESIWYPTFKAQGEFLDRKDDVSVEELEKIAFYFKEIYKMKDVHVGEFVVFPAKVKGRGEVEKVYGVTGKMNSWLDDTTFYYYWKASDDPDPEMKSLEEGWVGKMSIKEAGKHFPKDLRHFMSPLQFLECVEMHYFYSSKWNTLENDEHLSMFNKEMTALLRGRTKTRHNSKKFGLS